MLWATRGEYSCAINHEMDRCGSTQPQAPTSVGANVGSSGRVRRAALVATGSRSLESAVAGRRGQRNGAPDCDAYPEGSGGPHSRRNSPSLLPGRCSMSSSRLVAAGAARGAGVLLAKGSGTGPVAVRGGSRNALCLQGVSALFCLRRSFGGGCGVVTPDGIMLPVERAGLGQAGAAAQFGSRHDTGPALFLGQEVAILAGGGAELR